MIYFDHNATTPCLPEVVDVMMPYFFEKFGNPSSGFYPLSWQSKVALEESKQTIADLLEVHSDELIMTSGSTEACYLGIRGLIELYHQAKPDFKPHVISSQLEHSAVKETLLDLERMGWCDISWVNNDANGLIRLCDLEILRQDNTILLALMLANNVTGVLQDISSLSAWAKEHKIVTFCDTTQAIGKLSISLRTLGVDMATMSAHKMYGPKGIGCLFLRKGRPSLRIKSLLTGGGQENSKRGGTENVPAIVGFAHAARRAPDIILQYQKVQELRDLLEEKLYLLGDKIQIWGQSAHRLPHVSMIGIKDVRAVDLMNQLKGKYAFSLGSACQAHENKPSYVIKNMDPSSKYIDGSIRISLGIGNTKAEVLSFVNDIQSIITQQSSKIN